MPCYLRCEGNGRKTQKKDPHLAWANQGRSCKNRNLKDDSRSGLFVRRHVKTTTFDKNAGGDNGARPEATTGQGQRRQRGKAVGDNGTGSEALPVKAGHVRPRPAMAGRPPAMAAVGMRFGCPPVRPPMAGFGGPRHKTDQKPLKAGRNL